MLLKDVTKEIEVKEKKENNIDFPVEIQKLKTFRNLNVEGKAIVRKDKDQVIGVVGNDYKFISHKEVLQSIEKVLPTDLTKRKTILCKNGAVMFARYETPMIPEVEIKVGDVVKFGIEVFNSYDGSTRVGFMFNALRLVCKNGMTIPKSIVSISSKHTSRLDLNKAKREFQQKMPLHKKSVEQWQQWTTHFPGKEAVNRYLSDKVGQRNRHQFVTKYCTLPVGEDNLWGFYNILTRYNTHEIKVHNPQNTRLAQINFEKRVIEPIYSYNWN